MSRAVSPSTNRPYGVAMVTRLWRIARGTVYRHRSPAAEPPRPGPVGPMPDDAPVAADVFWARWLRSSGSGRRLAVPEAGGVVLRC